MEDKFRLESDITSKHGSEGLRRFNQREAHAEEQENRSLREARMESSRERHELASKPVKTVAEWQQTFTEHMYHPEDTGDFKYVLSTFLMDMYPRDKDDPDYIASVGDFDFAVMLEADKHGGDEAIKKIKNRFVNWLTWKRPEEIKEMRDEARNLIFNVGAKVAHRDGLGHSVIENFLEQVEERPVLGMLAEKYKGQDPEVWQDQVAGNFLEYLKGYGEYGILKDIASVVNRKIKSEKTGGPRVDTSSHIRNDKGVMESRKLFQPGEKQAKAPQPEIEGVSGDIDLKFDEDALNRLTNGPDVTKMSKENLRVAKAFRVFRSLWGKKDGFSKISLGIDGMKASAILFRTHYGEDFVLPMQYVRNILGIYPVSGWEIPDAPNETKNTVVGIKFKARMPSPVIYPRTPGPQIENIFRSIKIDGVKYNSRLNDEGIGKMPYKYVEIADRPEDQ